jgi:hypothetical protein
VSKPLSAKKVYQFPSPLRRGLARGGERFGERSMYRITEETTVSVQPDMISLTIKKTSLTY